MKEHLVRKPAKFSPRFIKKIKGIDDACQKALMGQYNPPMYANDMFAIIETRMMLQRFFPDIFNSNSNDKEILIDGCVGVLKGSGN